MADRIRSNPAGAYAGAGPGANNGCVNGAGDCAADAMAADDWFRWFADLQRRLPAGANATGATQNIAPLTQYTITIAWPEVGQDTPASYTLALQL